MIQNEKSLQADEIPQSLENRLHIVNRPPGCFSCRHVFGGFFIVIYNEIGNYLDKLQKGRPSQYHFEVANEGIVYGSLTLLGSNVDYSLTFDPKVMPNGNIELHANKLALGKFPVPISFVLMYVKQNYKLPKWVQLIPKDKTIKLDIIHMNGKNGINYRARTIDLKGQGKFAFEILLPTTDKED